MVKRSKFAPKLSTIPTSASRYTSPTEIHLPVTLRQQKDACYYDLRQVFSLFK